jgi:hypothetical protein
MARGQVFGNIYLTEKRAPRGSTPTTSRRW